MHRLTSRTVHATGAALAPLLTLCAALGCAPAATTATAATTGAATTAPTRAASRDTGPAGQPPGAVLTPASPASVGMRDDIGATIDALARRAVADSVAPAIAIAVGRHGHLVKVGTYGHLFYSDTTPAVDVHTRFDMASLTKVVATTTAAMMLEDAGKLDINRPVSAYLPEFNAPDKQGITVRMLITHRGGMEAFSALYNTTRGRQAYLAAINARPLAYTPGTKSIYSDWDYVLMQAIVERISGDSLDTFTERRIFAPLGMMETGFRPDSVDKRHIAPTEIDSVRGQVWGSVHDENAAAIGGVSGHAGLFSTIHDVAIFTQMLLNGGSYGNVRIVAPETVARWTAVQDPGSSRALGWDTPSAHSSSGRFFSPRSYGHTGFTGTSIWTDPQRDVWVVVLTNRVYPTRKNMKIARFRREIADVVQQSITDSPLIDWESTTRK